MWGGAWRCVGAKIAMVQFGRGGGRIIRLTPKLAYRVGPREQGKVKISDPDGGNGTCCSMVKGERRSHPLSFSPSHGVISANLLMGRN